MTVTPFRVSEDIVSAAALINVVLNDALNVGLTVKVLKGCAKWSYR